MTSRIVRIGKRSQQVITTRWVAGTHPGFTTVHEHVTLATPHHQTDTQRLRVLTVRDTGKEWRS
jgi:triacylglycerol esterase/lipase EstA (alpha/beta hydrolase family)